MKRWKKVRAAIHREVCEKGFDKKLNSFVQSYGVERRWMLRACGLRWWDFCRRRTREFVGTVEAIEKRLMKNGLVQRYKTRETEGRAERAARGVSGVQLLDGDEPVADWAKDDAKAMFERLLALRNDVGLLSEEYDSGGEADGGEFSAGAVAYLAGACGVCDVGRVAAAAAG